MQSSMSRPDAERLVALVRERILTLFPGREQTYEVVYARRFRRLLDEFAVPSSTPPAVVLPFPERGR
jgi:hypothetical protein